MTLEEAAYIYAMSDETIIGRTPIKTFIAGARWYQANHSCCCGGCTKHNIELVSTKQNSEFDDL